MQYFSEREFGEQPPMKDEISKTAWNGIKAYVNARVTDGSFGSSYPVQCPEGNATIGTDANGFWKALESVVPGIAEQRYHDVPHQTFDILDMIEFCWCNIAHPTIEDYHHYFRHNDLRFLDDAKEVGQKEFREAINDIFRRNKIIYTLTEEGKIERVVYTVLKEELTSVHFSTEDPELNGMLEKARQKFLDKNENTRREALQDLWDAWERLKTLENPDKKKDSIKAILDHTAGSESPKFRAAIEQEAIELTRIGNKLQIRHSEKNQEKVSKAAYIDYLFHRLFSLVQLILRARK